MKFDTTFVLNNFLFPLRVYDSNVLHYVCWGKQLLDFKLIKDKDVKYLKLTSLYFNISSSKSLLYFLNFCLSVAKAYKIKEKECHAYLNEFAVPSFSSFNLTKYMAVNTV